MAERIQSRPVESVFTAHNDALLEAAEQLLRDSGVEYDVALEALPEVAGSDVCYQRLVLQVPADRADESRRLLIAGGFAHDIVAS